MLKQFQEQISLDKETVGQAQACHPLVGLNAIDNFSMLWIRYCPTSLQMYVGKLPAFLNDLSPPLGFKNNPKKGVQMLMAIKKLSLPHRNGKLHALELERALAYLTFAKYDKKSHFDQGTCNNSKLQQTLFILTMNFPILMHDPKKALYSVFQIICVIKIQALWRGYIIRKRLKVHGSVNVYSA